MIEVGILVILACANFIWNRDVFWQLLVTVEYDDVSTKLIMIFIIELGIWVIQACANFIRGCHVFWLLLVPKEWCINNLSGECSLVPLSLPGDHGSGWMDGWMRTSVRGFDNNGAIVIAALYNACHGNGCKITVTLNLKLNKLLSDENSCYFGMSMPCVIGQLRKEVH